MSFRNMLAIGAVIMLAGGCADDDTNSMPAGHPADADATQAPATRSRTLAEAEQVDTDAAHSEHRGQPAEANKHDQHGHMMEHNNGNDNADDHAHNHGHQTAPGLEALPEGARTFEIEAGEMYFNPTEIEVAPGETFGLKLINNGAIVHVWEIEGRPETHIHAEAGETSTGVITAPEEPGEYAVVCPLPGHTEGGMTGKLIVSEDIDPADNAHRGDGNEDDGAPGEDHEDNATHGHQDH